MVAYSFKRQFAEPILAEPKRQTIRANRRRHARPGEELQLYTGMRTRHCKLITRATCSVVLPIVIEVEAWRITASGRVIHIASDLDAFARSDGFASRMRRCAPSGARTIQASTSSRAS